jgi:hypothetical protein
MVPQTRLQGIGRFLAHHHGHMRILTQGDRDRRMPQEIADELRVLPLAEAKGSTRVAEIMEPDWGSPARWRRARRWRRTARAPNGAPNRLLIFASGGARKG